MKRFILCLVFAIVSISTFASESSLFVLNTKTHKYEYVDSTEWKTANLQPIGDVQVGAPIYYGVKNGYTSDELYVYMTNNCFFVLKSFTSQIYYVIVLENVTSISVEDVNRNMTEFDYDKVFVDYGTRKYKLKGKIRQSFMEEILDKKAVNNKLIDNFNKYEYTFKDGWLISASTLSGLSEDAEKYLDSPMGKKIKYNAEQKHFKKEDVYKEINFQFECLFALDPKAINIVKNEIINYNAAIVYFFFFYHKYEVTFDKFKFYAGKYKIKEKTNNQTIVEWNDIMQFTFENNILIDTKTIKH